jgi:cold shock protein
MKSIIGITEPKDSLITGKGFGFIKAANWNQDYFVSVFGLIDEIRKNNEVTFNLLEGRKGLNAVNIKRA